MFNATGHKLLNTNETLTFSQKINALKLKWMIMPAAILRVATWISNDTVQVSDVGAELLTLLMTARSSAAVRAALICRIRSRNLMGVGIFTLQRKGKISNLLYFITYRYTSARREMPYDATGRG